MPTSPCSFPDCYKPVDARGLCTGHYRQWRKGRDLSPLRPMCSPKMSGAERFWLKVKFSTEPNGCHEWTASSRGEGGYGAFGIGGKVVDAHRFSLSLKLGRPLLPGMYACHACDNPPCVRQDHLFEGSRADNVHDCHQKLRHSYADKSYNAKLTSEAVIAIRASSLTHTQLARIYGVNFTTLKRARLGRSWKHLLTDDGVSDPPAPERPSRTPRRRRGGPRGPGDTGQLQILEIK